MPSMSLWIGFACIPQECGRGGGSDIADHFVESDLAKAVASILLQVANSAFALVLASIAVHIDKHHICKYSSWPSRG